jgi:hypothetical protein
MILLIPINDNAAVFGAHIFTYSFIVRALIDDNIMCYLISNGDTIVKS